MFFPERITKIAPNDRVLEIGPGGLPHPRSDVFLELEYDDSITEEMQRGFANKPEYNKPVHYYNGIRFPFSDKEFDYVICSHVLEHVEDIDVFISELFRISSKGYLEYPTIYYEYLYNFPVHINILKKRDNELLYIKKQNTHLFEFVSVQKLFYHSLEQEYFSLVNSLQPYMFEGFEWLAPFEVRKAGAISELTWETLHIPKYSQPTKKPSILRKLKNIISRITSVN